MHIHIVGICGTFMGGVALLAKEMGYTVTGSDTHVYPPMSTLLSAQGVEVMDGFEPSHLQPEPDLVVIGNALSRGNPIVERVLNRGLNYTSGPAFLGEKILKNRWVLAVAGTHGKTTTSSMLAWILEYAGLKPGFLIGGVPENFGVSARLGDAPFFVVEADEYDSAFFDKRSKFIHYRARTAVLNNLEFDHADIFEDISDIKRQFHHFVRTLPGNALIIYPEHEAALSEVIEQGCWSEKMLTASQQGWQAQLSKPDGSQFEVSFRQRKVGSVRWDLIGQHNVNNGLSAIAAAQHAGVIAKHAVEALNSFKNVKRRLEVLGSHGGITVYDDFAHHPTAIASTLAGLRQKVGNARIIALLEPRSNTMRMGVHRGALAGALAEADIVLCLQPEGLNWMLAEELRSESCFVFKETKGLIQQVMSLVQQGDHVIIMSNGAFDGIHQKILAAIAA